jgi:heme-degrading protein
MVTLNRNRFFRTHLVNCILHFIENNAGLECIRKLRYSLTLRRRVLIPKMLIASLLVVTPLDNTNDEEFFDKDGFWKTEKRPIAWNANPELVLQSKDFERILTPCLNGPTSTPATCVSSSRVPIIFEGKVIGAIGVSGNTPQEDEDIAKIGAAAISH